MHFREAVDALARRAVKTVRTASLYLTEPRDFLDQPWFLNTILEASTELSPEQLLEACLAVEREAGRVRDASKGPRPIDVDILLYDNQVIRTPNLVIPHPSYTKRRFVLIPLAELLPEMRDPQLNLTIKQLLKICDDSGSVRLFGAPLIP